MSLHGAHFFSTEDLSRDKKGLEAKYSWPIGRLLDLPR